MAVAFQPGDVLINTVMVISPRGSIDLSADLIEMKIYENIMVPNNICEITVIDGSDAIGGLLIQGDEQIGISFTTPGGATLNYVFALDLISVDAILGAQKAKQYTLHGVGQETLQSKTNYIQKAYNTIISSIVQDIHTNYLKSMNSLATEVTQGIQNILIPNIKPFEAIDLVRRRASSSSNPSSTFLYFQDCKGHNFKTIEGMMNSKSVKIYIHSDALNTSIYINNFNNILDYEVPQIISSTERIDLGSLNQRTSSFDLRTRNYKVNNQAPAASPFNSSLFKAMYGSAYGLFNFIPFDSAARPQTYIPTSTPAQMSYLANIMQGWINLKCYGDTNITVGQVMTCNIPESISTTTNFQLDPLISGNYLISKICRQISSVETKPRYVDLIEGIRGSFPS